MISIFVRVFYLMRFTLIINHMNIFSQLFNKNQLVDIHIYKDSYDDETYHVA